MTIVGTGSGLSYASLGPTHHSLEDVAMLRCLPNMKVICPADSAEVRGVLPAVLKQDKPAYIRLGKKGEPAVHRTDPPFVIGRGIVLSEGTDVCFLGMGNAVIIAVEAAEKLRQRGISSKVVSLHTVKPLDDALLEDAFKRFKAIVVVEEHSVIGGLGSAVAEWIVARRLLARGSWPLALPMISSPRRAINSTLAGSLASLPTRSPAECLSWCRDSEAGDVPFKPRRDCWSE